MQGRGQEKLGQPWGQEECPGIKSVKNKRWKGGGVKGSMEMENRAEWPYFLDEFYFSCLDNTSPQCLCLTHNEMNGYVFVWIIRGGECLGGFDGNLIHHPPFINKQWAEGGNMSV
jgi:hypothetical protein